MTKAKRYAIIDVETTGGRAVRDKITEIAIVLHDGEKIIETFESLINPDCYIPYGITELTGITQSMVETAPKFYEVARDIVKLTEGAIFVAHNVRFDYTFIREEFARLGYAYSRKQLCTVRLSRRVFPGLGSYSLDNLIRHFNLPIENRHRAMGDARATTVLFEKILAKQSGKADIAILVNLEVKESLLPPNFSMEKLHGLPDTAGVYYFHNSQGDVVYVGKSIHIKKRIAEHFADTTDKSAKLQREVFDISYEETGSELIALLKESAEIKRLSPALNRAQRRRSFPYAVHAFSDENGYLRFDVAKPKVKERKALRIISEFPNIQSAKSRLMSLAKRFELCHKLCGTDKSRGACFSYFLQGCQGACVGEETPEDYNGRAEAALESLKTIFDKDFFVIDNGRTPGEKAVVLVRNGYYQGFGYIDATGEGFTQDDLLECITPAKGTPDMARIIQHFLADQPRVKVLPLEKDQV